MLCCSIPVWHFLCQRISVLFGLQEFSRDNDIRNCRSAAEASLFRKEYANLEVGKHSIRKFSTPHVSRPLFTMISYTIATSLAPLPSTLGAKYQSG